MRKSPIVIACFFLSMCLLLTGCTMVDKSNVATDALSKIDSTVSSGVASDFIEENKVQRMPDIHTQPEIEFEPIERLGQIIEQEFAVYAIPDDLRAAINNLSDSQYAVEMDKYNYFQFGDRMLFFTATTAVGPSEICVERGGGSVESICYSSQPIVSMALTLDRTGFIVELAETVGYDGYKGNVHFLNINEAKLESLPYPPTSGGHGFGYKYYYDNLFYIENTGERMDIYQSNTDNPTLMAQSSPLTNFQFANGKIFYWDEYSLYSTTLDGASEVIYEGDGEILDYFIYGKHLVYFASDTITVVNLVDGQEINHTTTGPNIRGFHYADDTGFYYVDLGDNERVLRHFSYDGEETILLTNFVTSMPFVVSGEWVYFTTTYAEAVNLYSYWKVDLNNLELAQIS